MISQKKAVVHILLKDQNFTDIMQRVREQEEDTPYKIEVTKNEN